MNHETVLNVHARMKPQTHTILATSTADQRHYILPAYSIASYSRLATLLCSVFVCIILACIWYPAAGGLMSHSRA